jgi:HAD superfamily hydrolase (TIGR01549 family)
MKPTVIAFDVFGTLVKIGNRKSPYKRMMKWMKDQGRKPKTDDARIIMSNHGGFDDIAALLGMPLPDDLFAELNSDLNQELSSIELYGDTLRTLAQLKHLGFKVAVCSNLATPYGEAVFPMLPDLDAYIWSYEAGYIKPETGIYQALIAQVNCRASDVLFIGDTPLADVDGPRSFGMSAQLINRKEGQTLVDVLDNLI